MKSRNKQKAHNTIDEIYSSSDINFFITQVDQKGPKQLKKKKIIKKETRISSKLSYLPSITRNSSLPSLKSINTQKDSRPRTIAVGKRKRMSMSTAAINRLSKPRQTATTIDDLSNKGRLLFC